MSDELIDQVEVQEEVKEVLPPDYTVVVGDERIEIKKLTASKVATVSNIMGELLINGNRKLREFKATSDMAFFVGVLAALNENELVRLAAALIERDEQFVRDNFDLGWVLDALGKQMQVSNLRAVVANFTSLLSQLQ